MFFAKRDNLPFNLTSYDIVKCLTLLFMLVDHVGAFFLIDEPWWRVAGRLGFPVWFFLAGYLPVQKKMPQELWVGAALLISGGMVLGQYIFPLNALVTYIVIRLTIAHIGKRAFSNGEMLIYSAVVLFFLGVPTNYMFEYGTLAMLIALVGYACRNRDELGIGPKTRWFFSISAVVMVAVMQVLMFGFTGAKAIVCFAELSVVGIALLWFKPTEFPKLTDIFPKFLTKIIQFCGRYTLEVYVFHLLAIKVALLVMHYGFYKPFLPTLMPHFPMAGE